jgi:hypothetical protein
MSFFFGDISLVRTVNIVLHLLRTRAIIFIKVVAELKNDNEIDYAEIAREYFNSKKVHRYKMKKISDICAIV